MTQMKRMTSVHRAAPAAALLLAMVFSAPLPAVEPTWEHAQAEAARGGYRLITVDDLWERYQADSAGILLIDTRQGWEYRSGHITGAASFPMEPTWWARWKSRRELRRLLGPDRNRFLVFY